MTGGDIALYCVRGIVRHCMGEVVRGLVVVQLSVL